MIARINSNKKIYKIHFQLETTPSNYVFFFDYNKLLVQEIKVMAGAKWHPKGIDDRGPCWTTTINERNTFALKYLTLGKEAIPYRYTHDIDTLIPQRYVEMNYGTIKRPLMSHQLEAISYILTRRHCMLAYDMGLGKTLVGIEVMERCLTMHGIVRWWLVAPFGAQKAWEREIKKWDAQVWPCVVTSYESLHKYMDAIPESEAPQGIIFDESIRIKNPVAQRSQIAYELTKILRERSAPTFILLFTGAPAPKEPTDWWHQIECIFPGWIKEGNIHKFRERYAILEDTEGEFGTFRKIIGWREVQVKHLGTRLQPLVLRKTKDECLDLPDQLFEIIQVSPIPETLRVAEFLIRKSKTGIEALEKLRELSDGFQYQTVRDTSVDNNDSSDGLDVCGVRSKKCIWVGSPKMDVINELLDFYHTDNGGCGRLIIYAAFHGSVDKIMETVQKGGWEAFRIDGRGWSNQNGLASFENISHFPNICIVANPQCVHGLSFQQTECLVYYSNPFSVDARIQSLQRRDRPGMDTTKGTRIVDIINLETDKLILDKLNGSIELQEITLKEIELCLNK